MRMNDIDLTRHVRDAAYWGMPVGTPIVPGTRKKGLAKHAVKAARAKSALPKQNAGGSIGTPLSTSKSTQVAAEKALMNYMGHMEALPSHVMAHHNAEISDAVGVKVRVSSMLGMSMEKLREVSASGLANPKIRAAADAEIARRGEVGGRVLGVLKSSIEDSKKTGESVDASMERRAPKLHRALSNLGSAIAKFRAGAKHQGAEIGKKAVDVVRDAAVRTSVSLAAATVIVMATHGGDPSSLFHALGETAHFFIEHLTYGTGLPTPGGAAVG